MKVILIRRLRIMDCLVSRGIITLEDVSRFRALVIANEAHPRQAMHGGVDGSVTDNLKRLGFSCDSCSGYVMGN